MSVSDYVILGICLFGCYIALIGNLVLWLIVEKRIRTYIKIIEKENEDE